MDHNCYQIGAMGELLYICSRCSKCYVCDHHAVFKNGEWVWICKGKNETVIFDGRVKIMEPT